MKAPLKVNVLVWVTNILLVLLVLATIFILLAGFWASHFMVPGSDEMRGAQRYSSSISFMGDKYLYEREMNLGTGLDNEYFFLLDPDKSYQFSVSDSVVFHTRIVDKEPSAIERRSLGLIRTFERGHGVEGEEVAVPLLVGHPGIPFSRVEFIQRIRLELLFRFLSLCYAFSVLWYLRRFVKGLQQMNFFTAKNAVNLKVTSIMIIIAPFLESIWRNTTAIKGLQTYQASEFMSGEVEFMFGTLLFGMVLWVIAWCFDQGVEMQKEQELII